MSKYRNIKVDADGHRFDSRKEFRRYCDLKALQLGNAIEDLELQPRFPMVINGVKVCTYVADFRYRDRVSGEVIVEDAKGVRTPLYKLKARLLKAIHGIEIVEV